MGKPTGNFVKRAIIIIIIIIKSLFNKDSLLKTYQTYSACNIEMSLYTTRSSTKQ